MEIKYFVYQEEEPQRIDKYLASEIEETTRSLVQIYIKDGNALVNDKVVKANYLLEKGDEIKITIPDPISNDVLPQNIPLDIYYEDSDVIVVNKPSGMVVHPAVGNYQDTLVNALMYHCQDLSGINGVIRAGIVHRIDKDTSGLLVACKNDFSHKNLSEQFFNKTVSRIYYAIVYGVINHNLGRIEAPIGRDIQNRQQMTVVENGKNAVTNFKVLERFKKYTLVELSLETGRTHQIRVHMKYIGFPLVGDPIYGPKNVIGEHGQFLHAKTLGFTHPRTKKFLQFESPLPDYFEEFLKEIRNEE
ncbi:MAG: RluA family pseudouridine synthase [Bacilli bacterium]|nr:RluA family pseudouridine synthase [Bacilli bacterium]